jgi:hypothetical protein
MITFHAETFTENHFLLHHLKIKIILKNFYSKNQKQKRKTLILIFFYLLTSLMKKNIFFVKHE